MFEFVFKNGEELLLQFYLDGSNTGPINVVGDDSWFDYRFRPFSSNLNKHIGLEENLREWAIALDALYQTENTGLITLEIAEVEGFSKNSSSLNNIKKELSENEIIQEEYSVAPDNQATYRMDQPENSPLQQTGRSAQNLNHSPEPEISLIPEHNSQALSESNHPPEPEDNLAPPEPPDNDDIIADDKESIVLNAVTDSQKVSVLGAKKAAKENMEKLGIAQEVINEKNNIIRNQEERIINLEEYSNQVQSFLENNQIDKGFEAFQVNQRLIEETQTLSQTFNQTKSDLDKQLATAENQYRVENQKIINDLEREKEKIFSELESKEKGLSKEVASIEKLLKKLNKQVVSTEDTIILQEVGIYEYRHPIDTSDAYKDAIKEIKVKTKKYNKKGGSAVSIKGGWTVNGSEKEGAKMLVEVGNLLIRAYNSEVDLLINLLTPARLQSSLNRLNKTFAAINKNGTQLGISVNRNYHKLRIEELELNADYKQKKLEEKEAEKEQRRQLAEEKAVQKEIEAKRKKLEDKLKKEQEHYTRALARLEQMKKDQEAGKEVDQSAIDEIEKMKEEMQEIEKAVEDIDYRAANIKAGYVYVISNVGSFGEGIVKIGLTRRLEPMDRIKELGDASVPFNFDVHALLFSEDAVGIETALHHKFTDRRINRINMRREYFQATPAEVYAALKEVSGAVLEYEEIPEAAEYRQSLQELSELNVDIKGVVRP